MKSKIKKSLIFLTSTSLVITPLTLVSCSTIEFSDTSKQEQITLLTGENAQQVYLNEWAKSTFSAFYIEKVLGLELTSSRYNAIYSYLKHLVIPTNSDSTGIFSGFTGYVNDTKIYEDIYNLFFDSYKDYMGWNAMLDRNWFKNKVLGLNNSGDENSDSSNNNWNDLFIGEENGESKNNTTVGEYFFKDINQLDYYSYITSPSKPNQIAFNTKYEKDFKRLYNTPKTKIQTTILEMTLNQFYFNNVDETFIRGGTTYVKDVPVNPSTIEGWRLNNFSIKDPQYFLVKYLVDNTPVLQWNINSTDAGIIDKVSTNLRDSNGRFRTKDQIINKIQNEINLTTKNTLDENLTFTNNVDTEFSLLAKEFKGFNSSSFTLETSDNTENLNDLDLNRENLVNFQGFKSGFINKYNTKNNENLNKIISLKELEDMKKISDMTTSTLLPIVKLKTSNIKNVYATQLNNNHIDIMGVSDGSSVIDYITPIFSSLDTKEQEAKVTLTHTFNNGSKYTYDVLLKWNLDGVEIDPMNKNFDLKLTDSKYNVNGISALNNDDSAVDVTYVVRLLPKFIYDGGNNINDQDVNIVKIGEEYLPMGKFTLEGMTDDAGFKQISNLIYLQNNEYFTNVRQAFTWNDYALHSSTIPEVIDTMKGLGIYKLTSGEREENELESPSFTGVIKNNNEEISNPAFNFDAIKDQILKNSKLINEVNKYETRKRH